MKRIASLLVLCLCSAASGQDITVPSTVDAKTNRLASVAIKSTAKSLSWIIVPSTDIDIFREYDPDTSVIKLRFLPYRDGQFSLVIAGASGDKVSLSVCVITSTGAAPPPPPIPQDPFTKAVTEAYIADGGRPSQTAALAGVFRGTDISTAKTLKDAIGILHAKANAVMFSDTLPTVRRLIAVELNKAFGGTEEGVTNFDLDSTGRTKVIAQFVRIALVLDSIK